MNKAEQLIVKQLRENIDFLIKIRKEKIGEVETAIGVSIGYLSRAKEYNADLPISKVVRTAEYFGVSVDSLIHSNFKAEYLKQQIAELQAELKEVEGKNG
jgi:hypothetical protein